MGANCRLHPLIQILSSDRHSTTCGGGSERAKVGIKVCDTRFHTVPVGFHLKDSRLTPVPSNNMVSEIQNGGCVLATLS